MEWITYAERTAEIAPTVDQTNLAKFLEVLSPSLKNLAVSCNPKTFNEAVESAQFEELNKQFAITDVNPINNFPLKQPSSLDEKLDQFLEQ